MIAVVFRTCFSFLSLPLPLPFLGPLAPWSPSGLSPWRSLCVSVWNKVQFTQWGQLIQGPPSLSLEKALPGTCFLERGLLPPHCSLSQTHAFWGEGSGRIKNRKWSD